MIFCKRKTSCINALRELFTKYAQVSGQIINTSKSTLYSISLTYSRESQGQVICLKSISTLYCWESTTCQSMLLYIVYDWPLSLLKEFERYIIAEESSFHLFFLCPYAIQLCEKGWCQHCW